MSSSSSNSSAQACADPLACGTGGDQPNGQHHLLRHVLSPQQCSDALRHFGTTDSKAAARMVNRMSQRELRDMFAKVYSVHTNSNNNTWLRRKLLEAVGASRRFYNAANKTGRPKGRRPAAAATGSGHTSSGSAGPHPAAAAPKSVGASRPKHIAVSHHHPSPAAAAAPYHPHAMSSTALQHLAAAGAALPAGSPRALTQRLRPARAPLSGLGHSHASGTFDHHQFAQHHPQHPYYHLHRQESSEDDGTTCSGGSEDHAAPRALAPQQHAAMAAADCGSPTSVLAPRQPMMGSAFAMSMGSHNSLASSQFGMAPSPLMAPPQALPQALPSAGFMPAPPPPAMRHSNSLTALTALLGGSVELPAAPLGGGGLVPSGLPQPAPSADLGLLLGPGDSVLLPVAAKRQPTLGGEDWLIWGDDCQLPSLF